MPPTQPLDIRPARPADVPAILAMIHEMAEYERLTHLLDASAERLADDLFGKRPAVECVIAELRGQAAGYALFFHNYSTFLTRRGLYLEDLYVKAEARGHGAGKALMAHLAKLAHERGCGRFEWSVLDWNEPAIRFYESLGATVMPDWRVCRVAGDALARLGGGGDPARECQRSPTGA